MERTIAQIPNESNEVKVTVTLVLNASFRLSEKTGISILTYYLMACIILASLAIAAIVLNVCVLLAIFSSSNLKRLTLNQLVTVISFTCLVDCFLNIPFSMYYMKIRTGSLGIKMCTMNATFVLLISLMITWGVCGMCLERLISTWKRNKEKSAMFCKQSVTMGAPLLAAVAVVLPVLLGLIEVRVFPNRLSCFIANDKERQYRTLILLCFISPICLGVLALLSSLTINFRNIKNISVQRVDLSYAELFFEESHLWIEWQNTKFVGCIALLFSILEIPFIFKETECGSNKPPDIIPVLLKNMTFSGPQPVIQITPAADRAYSWVKFSFCLLFPLSTLLLRKDIRRKLMSMISFCRTNASIISKRSAKSGVTQQECPDDFLVPQGWRRRRRLSSVTSLTTPIVFGRPKVGNAQFQLLDISTGIARWKDYYNEPKSDSQKNGQTFFDHAFEDDEDEFTELVSYEDGTEEEINSSEEFQSVTTFKEVAIQTSEKCFGNEATAQITTHANFVDVDLELNGASPERKLRIPSRSQSKSFTANRTNYMVTRQRNYLTYPKLSPNSKYLFQIKNNPSTSDLLKALKAYRSKKRLTACDLLPRETGELMEQSLEARDVVSL